jgi:ABC-type nitrate/sulfonate/bicarbonate transport system permease component
VATTAPRPLGPARAAAVNLRWRRLWPAARAFTGRVLLGAWLPAALVAVWYVTSRNSSDLYYPPLPDIVAAIRDDWFGAHLVDDVVPSLTCLFAGLAASVVIGVGGGYVLGTIRPLREILAPILDAFRSTPAVALIPIFISIFGIGSTGEILIITWVCVWPVLLNTVDGVAGIELGYRDVGRVLRLDARQRFRLVNFPAASPQIMAGINTSIGLGVTVMVACEMYSSQRGIGFQLVGAQRNFDLASSYAGAIAAGAIGYLIAMLFNLLQRRVLGWHTEQRATQDGQGSEGTTT